jgi:hypothetical protein
MLEMGADLPVYLISKQNPLGSKELNAYHQTFSPRNLATPASIRTREFKLKHGPNKGWVVDLDFRAAFGDIQYRASAGPESPVDSYPRFLIARSAV